MRIMQKQIKKSIIIVFILLIAIAMFFCFSSVPKTNTAVFAQEEQNRACDSNVENYNSTSILSQDKNEISAINVAQIYSTSKGAWVYYTTLEDAVEASVDGDVIVVTANYYLSNCLDVYGKSIFLVTNSSATIYLAESLLEYSTTNSKSIFSVYGNTTTEPGLTLGYSSNTYKGLTLNTLTIDGQKDKGSIYRLIWVTGGCFTMYKNAKIQNCESKQGLICNFYGTDNMYIYGGIIENNIAYSSIVDCNGEIFYIGENAVFNNNITTSSLSAIISCYGTNITLKEGARITNNYSEDAIITISSSEGVIEGGYFANNEAEQLIAVNSSAEGMIIRFLGGVTENNSITSFFEEITIYGNETYNNYVEIGGDCGFRNFYYLDGGDDIYRPYIYVRNDFVGEQDFIFSHLVDNGFEYENDHNPYIVYEKGISPDLDALTAINGFHFTSEVQSSGETYVYLAANRYNVTWANYDGTVLLEQVVKYRDKPAYTGETPTRPATAQYTYTFYGWTPYVLYITEDVTFTARYTTTTNQYTISFYSENGDTLLGQSTVNYGLSAKFSGTTPTKTGTKEYTYSFSHWVTSPGGDVKDSLTNVVANRNVYAKFTATKNKYTIKFVNYDGTILKSGELEYGKTPYYSGTTPSKTGTAKFSYTFNGWTPSIIAVVGDATYTATFTETINKYTIKFVNYDGTTLQSGKIEYGQMPSYSKTNPTRAKTAKYTYTFNGWTPSIVAVVGDVTYTATYTETINKYIIKFVNYDGTILQSGELEYGKTPLYSKSTPTRAKTAEYTYIFSSWTPSIVAVVGDATYTATFSAVKNKYTITFYSEDGLIELGKSTVNYGSSATYTGATPTKTATAEYSYSFSYWVTSPGGSVKDGLTNVVMDRNVYAKFTATKNKYVIKFINYDNTELQSIEVEYGKTPSYTGTTPTKPKTPEYSYTFSGWSPSVVVVVSDATYTATFSAVKNKYTIKFVNYNGTELECGQVEYGKTPNYTGQTPTRAKTAQFTYTFSGWSPSVVAVVGDATYFARFLAVTNKYIVKFVNYNGIELQTSELEYGKTPSYTAAIPVRARTAEFTYTFSGWTPSIVAVVGNATYTATFAEATNKYTIKFINYDGVELQSGELEYGKMPTYTSPTPTRARTSEFTYTFSGWTPSIVAVVGNATYTAIFTETTNKYTIKFVNYDRTELQSTELEYGKTPAYTGLTPTRAKTAQFTYTFSGWTPSIVAVVGNATYTAIFTETTNKYTIKFVNYDGTELQSSELEYGKTPAYTGLTPTRAKTAQFTYTFSGWTPGIADVVGNAIYTATFSESINKYTIRFINYDGSELQKSELEYGEMPVYTGEEPIKPATAEFTYTFIGWGPDIVAVTEDTTYTAQFSDSFHVYVITWKNYDGNILAISNVEYGEMPVYTGEEPLRDATAQYTYTFNGWTPSIVAVAGDATYTATFTETINKYTIKFVNYDGTELQSSEFEYGKTPAYIGLTPTRAKTAEFTYAFSGWTPSVIDVVGNAIYTATFSESINKYAIIFVNYDGTELQSSQIEYGEMPVYTGEEPIKPATAEFTYTFIGWSPNIKAVIEDTIYTAQFSDSSQVYVITWKNYDGSILATSNVEYGEMPVYTGEEPIKPATAEFTYTFSGWTPSIVIVAGDVTYTATFAKTINKYTITFYSEDGNIELGVTTVNYGETATYMGTMPTKDSTAEFTFEFECWVTEVSGAIKDDLSNVVANRSVYAKFTATKNKYTIVFVNYDGNELQSSEVEYGEMPVYTGEEPTKTRTAEYSYIFSGWSPNLVVVVADATYTASYNEVKNKYIIKFINYDGTELQNSEIEYGEMPVYSGEEPIRIGTDEYSYIFCGWNPRIATVMSDTTYTANFNEVKNKYTIKFVNFNGDELQVGEFEYGEMPTYTSVTPTRESTAEHTFTFIGWEPSIVAVVGDATYTAVYDEVKNKYTIKFVNFDNSELQVEELEYGDTPTYKGEIPIRPSTIDLNFTFIGWDPKIVAVTKDIIYTAQFANSSQVYTITWNNYDGSVLAITDIEYGKMPIYDGVEPTKQATAQYSYSFNGWTPELVIVSGDATYTATFIEVINQYKVTFYLDDGITKIGEITVDYGADATYEGLTPQKATTAEYTYTFNC